jgi:hypothetical protein
MPRRLKGLDPKDPLHLRVELSEVILEYALLGHHALPFAGSRMAQSSSRPTAIPSSNVASVNSFTRAHWSSVKVVGNSEQSPPRDRCVVIGEPVLQDGSGAAHGATDARVGPAASHVTISGRQKSSHNQHFAMSDANSLTGEPRARSRLLQRPARPPTGMDPTNALTLLVNSGARHLMLAQGLGEYGAVGGGGGAFSSLASALAATEDIVRDEPRTWIIASVCAVLFWFLFLRKR